MTHGRPIRQRLQDVEIFRDRFRDDLWHRLERAASRGVELYLGDDRIWDLLALDNSEELLTHCGLLATKLVYGYPRKDLPAYPEQLHPKITQILLRREQLPIQALLKFRREPLFHMLLTRNLSSETLAAALAKLFQAGPSYPNELARFARLSDAALAKEVRPPPEGLIT